eukprot:SAG31_NODE_2737_length_5157_cov_7.756869_2_plen_259_part_00
MVAVNPAAMLLLPLCALADAQRGSIRTDASPDVVGNGGSSSSSTVTAVATEIADAARQLRSDMPVEEALALVQLDSIARSQTSAILVGLGFRTALDLALLGGGKEAAELLGELQTVGMSIGDRSKIRLLVGDRAHAEAVSSPPVCTRTAAPINRLPPNPRRMQENGSSHADDGLSMDTLAIVFSVTVGTVGYILYAHISSTRGAADWTTECSCAPLTDVWLSPIGKPTLQGAPNKRRICWPSNRKCRKLAVSVITKRC